MGEPGFSKLRESHWKATFPFGCILLRIRMGTREQDRWRGFRSIGTPCAGGDNDVLSGPCKSSNAGRSLKLAAVTGRAPAKYFALQRADITVDGWRITRGTSRGIIQTNQDPPQRADRSDQHEHQGRILPNEKGNWPPAHGNYWRGQSKPAPEARASTGSFAVSPIHRTDAGTCRPGNSPSTTSVLHQHDNWRVIYGSVKRDGLFWPSHCTH